MPVILMSPLRYPADKFSLALRERAPRGGSEQACLKLCNRDIFLDHLLVVVLRCAMEENKDVFFADTLSCLSDPNIRDAS